MLVLWCWKQEWGGGGLVKGRTYVGLAWGIFNPCAAMGWGHFLPNCESLDSSQHYTTQILRAFIVGGDNVGFANITDLFSSPTMLFRPSPTASQQSRA